MNLSAISIVACLWAQTETSTTEPGFREVRPEKGPGLEPGRLILSLPAQFVELGFAPVIPIVRAVGKYRVVQTVVDIFTSDDLSFGAAPIIIPFGASGLGFGGIVAQNKPLGSPDRFVAFGLYRLNEDRQLSLSLGRRVPGLSGRVFNASASYSVNHDRSWFGQGSNTEPDDQRLIRVDEILARVGVSELFPQLVNVDGRLELGFRRREILTGEGSFADPIEPTDPLPPGFGQSANYGEVEASFRYDTRDGLGRSTRGLVWNIRGLAGRELRGGSEKTGGLQVSTQGTLLIPVLPRNRVLTLSAGAGAALPVFTRTEVALHQLVNLGGANTLRGYQPNRFLDRYGWWSTAEYRFLLSDYGGSLVGFSGALFVDAGAVAGELEDLIPSSIPWSVGIGIRAETDILLLGRFQIAVSPDGLQVTLGIGEWF